MNTETAIKVTHLSKVFPLRHPRTNENGEIVHEHWALRDVSFEIKKGESVGIIGPNGSGKSTLLQILAGVTKPTEGTIEIRGKVASILDIGAGFHPELSGRENVYLNGQIHGFSTKEIESKFAEIVEFSGIRDFIEEPVKNYSNGMYLRLAFSIMVHLDFDVYLFDEVMSVGDAQFREKATKELDRILLKRDKTVVQVSHQLNELSENNFFIVLRSGELVKMARNHSLLTDYVEESFIKQWNKKVYNRPFEVNEFGFDIEKSYDDVELVSVILHQDSDIIVTDKEIWIEVIYEKLLNKNTLDIVLVINDANDNVVFVSSPISNGKINDDSKQRRGKAICKIPSNILVSAMYKITIRFLKNINFILESDLQDVESHINPTFKDIVMFKPEYRNVNAEIDLQKINSKYSLFIKTDWIEQNIKL